LDEKIANIVNNKKQETINYTEINQNNTSPINDILCYLKGKNEHGQQIMSQTDYNILIDLIEKIYNNQEYTIERKLEINVSVGVLRYTFYVLHLYLFGNAKNDCFIQFLLDAILTFKKWDFPAFKSKLSEPPSKLPSYIPQIIKDQRQKQIIKEN
jgi:hypothetical protein